MSPYKRNSPPDKDKSAEDVRGNVGYPPTHPYTAPTAAAVTASTKAVKITSAYLTT